MALTYEMLFVLFGVAMLAGFIDAIAGGGGLLTVPALLAAGLPPAQALATNKLQSVGGSFSASLYFVRQHAIDLAEQKSAIIFTFFGAMLGAISVQQLDAAWLRLFLPFAIILVGVYFLLMPAPSLLDRPRRLSSGVFGLVIGSTVGFYDGFLGPGTGSFFCIAYVFFAGYSLTKSTAHAKILNFTSNFAALIFFMIGGKVVWALGLLMLVGQFIGARLGAKLVLTQGQTLIRPMMIVMSILMSLKLINDQYPFWPFSF